MEQIGPYQIERELARGGMGIVYLARHEALDQPVALKLLKAPIDPTLLARFQREAEALALLKHPNVVPVHAIGIDDGHPYVALALIEGESLQQRLDRDGPLEPRLAARLIAETARAVAHAHARGIVHRDLKPANILLDADERPLLTDFGLARFLSEERERLTRSGEILGTPGFMPPEQANGEHDQIGPAADVYGLGATLFALLCGRPPFTGTSAFAVIMALTGRPPPSPRSLRPELEPALERICLRALEKAPTRRHLSAAALADDLDRYLAGEDVASPRTRASLALVAIAIVLALIGLATHLTGPDEPGPLTPSSELPRTLPPSPQPPKPPPRAMNTVALVGSNLELQRLWAPQAPSPLINLGDWRGDFLPGDSIAVGRRNEREVYVLDRAKQLQTVGIPGPLNALTTRGPDLVLGARRAVYWLSLTPGQVPVQLLPPAGEFLQALVVSQDGSTGFAAWTTGRRGTKTLHPLQRFDLNGPKRPTRVVRTQLRNMGRVTALALSRDGTIAAASSGVGDTRACDLWLSGLGSQRRRHQPTFFRAPKCLTFSPDERVVVFGMKNGGLEAFQVHDFPGTQVWHTGTLIKSRLLEREHPALALCYLRPGLLLVGLDRNPAGDPGKLVLYETGPSSARPLQTLDLRHGVLGLRLNPARDRLLVLTRGGPSLWSVQARDE